MKNVERIRNRPAARKAIELVNGNHFQRSGEKGQRKKAREVKGGSFELSI